MANRLIYLLLSFFIAGLGIVYLGNPTMGVGLILLWLISSLVFLYSTGLISIVVGFFSLIIWTYSLFTTFFMSISK